MHLFPDRWPEPLTPPVTGWLSQAHVLGVSMFFHSYVVTIPSWINEKAEGVDVNGCVWYPSFATAIIKVVFGLMGAWAYRLLVRRQRTISSSVCRCQRTISSSVCLAFICIYKYTTITYMHSRSPTGPTRVQGVTLNLELITSSI